MLYLNDGVDQTFGIFFIPVQFPLNCGSHVYNINNSCYAL